MFYCFSILLELRVVLTNWFSFSLFLILQLSKLKKSSFTLPNSLKLPFKLTNIAFTPLLFKNLQVFCLLQTILNFSVNSFENS